MQINRREQPPFSAARNPDHGNPLTHKVRWSHKEISITNATSELVSRIGHILVDLFSWTQAQARHLCNRFITVNAPVRQPPTEPVRQPNAFADPPPAP
jgi:hypothetical protein